MTERQRSNLPWLDRLTMAVPGYGGYEARARRREAAFALRDAMLRRLNALRGLIEKAKQQCDRHEATSEIGALDRLEQNLDRLIARVQGLGTRYDTFYTAPDLDASKVNPIHGIDLALVNKAEEMLRHFEHPDMSHNLLAHVQSDLTTFEVMLDGRALMLQGVKPT